MMLELLPDSVIRLAKRRKPMKKSAYSTILLACLAVLLSVAMNSYAGNETVVGKLMYDKYEHYPYFFEIKDNRYIALEVDLDKNLRNKTIDKFVGKIVQVQGPARVITAKTEIQGLKIIDVRPGKGTISEKK
jgi:hypothetical protein